MDPTILLQGSLMTDILMRAGYEVLVAAHPREALEQPCASLCQARAAPTNFLQHFPEPEAWPYLCV
jgi:hypothetical protein